MIVAVLQALACVEAIYHKNWQMAVVFAGFAVGSAGVSWGK